MEEWKSFIANANVDIFDVLKNAIKVAASDHPNEFRTMRDKIAEMLFSRELINYCGGGDMFKKQSIEYDESKGPLNPEQKVADKSYGDEYELGVCDSVKKLQHAANLCKLCIRVLRFDPECDNCTYQPLNTNILMKCVPIWRDLKRRVVTENTRKDVVESNIVTQTSIAESASQRRSTDIDLHNHSQLAIHLRQPPSINAISQDPPSIHTISQEENSGAAHSLSAQICPFMRHASYSNAEHRRSDSVFNEGSRATNWALFSATACPRVILRGQPVVREITDVALFSSGY
ncbi:hypothetical protein Tco_0776034 [Tanacetum coccineum]